MSGGRVVRGSCLVFALIFLCGCYEYEVDKGAFYRSPQLNAKDLEAAVTTFNIRTVINLRGPGPGRAWYDEEKAVLEKLNVKLVDIPMSAKRLPHRRDLIQLLDTYKTAARPILVHCQAGVDRTGEASALYQMIYMNKTREQALEMLSARFGHMDFFMPAKRYFIHDVWQGEDWAYREYDPCQADYLHYPKRSPECGNSDSVEMEEILGDP